MSGKVEKMIIQSYKTRDFNKKGEDPVIFTVPINPESFTKNYKVNLDTRGGHGNQGTDPGYKSTAPEELKLDFILDGTNTMEGYDHSYDDVKVHDQLDKFLKTVYDMSSEIHRPRFLIVIWGSEINFRCVLSNLDINHTLFNSSGEPLRVRIGATFLKYKTKKEQEAEQRKSSPDLTHYRKFKLGDRLDLLTYNIYNSPAYLLQVARANGISNVRNITPGTELYFPPFDKNEV